jgi:quercetin dioxygenase-like cupin family protein
MKSGNLVKALSFALLASTSSLALAAPCDPNAPGACTEMLLDTKTTWDGAKMHYMQTRHPELTVRTIQTSPGTYNDWHIHEAPVYIYVMSGDFEVIMIDKNGQEVRKTYHAGEAFNEVVDTVHKGGNPSSSTWTKLLVMNPSERNCPFMTPEGSPYLCD